MRIFEENKINAEGKLLPYKEFRLFRDIENPQIPPELQRQLIERAEIALTHDISLVTITSYMRFYRDGDRSEFEGLYFSRRYDLISCLFGELCEQKGRFSDRILDLAWLILDESIWIGQAHVKICDERALPTEWSESLDNIDIMAGMTTAALSWTYYYADKVVPALAAPLKERIYHELDRRIFKPFMQYDILSWMGYTLPGHLKKMNNWGPWVSSNILLATALCVDDDGKRVAHCNRLMEILDNYLDGFAKDGGCEEGPTYWGASAGKLLAALEILYDMSGGKIDIFDNEIIRNIGEYIVRVNIKGNRYVTYSDSHPEIAHDGRLIARYGRRTGSQLMLSFGTAILPELCGRELNLPALGHGEYSEVKHLYDYGYEKSPQIAPQSYYFDSIEVLVKRFKLGNRDIFFSAKGGFNLESHNHNDVGSFVLYCGGEPVFIDAGVGTYTKATFDLTVRYTIWSMMSSYHNTPDFGEYRQHEGENFKAENVKYDGEKFSMSVAKAYEREANLEYYDREFSFGDELCISEHFGGDFCPTFNFLLADRPEITEPGKISLPQGLTLSYPADMAASIEEVALTDLVFVTEWKRKCMYRLRISSPATDGNVVFKIC